MKVLTQEELNFISDIENRISAYANKLQADGMLNKQHIRLATKPTVSELEGADGIVRTVTTPPKGMFLVVPNNSVELIQKAIKLRAEEHNGNYLSFTADGKKFEIGSCSKNNLRSKPDAPVFEIWFDTKLGASSQPVFESYSAIFNTLEERNKVGERAVVVKDELKSVTQKQPDTVTADKDDLPF